MWENHLWFYKPPFVVIGYVQLQGTEMTQEAVPPGNQHRLGWTFRETSVRPVVPSAALNPLRGLEKGGQAGVSELEDDGASGHEMRVTSANTASDKPETLGPGQPLSTEV